MTRELEFVPFPGLSDPNWQTLAAALPVLRSPPPSFRELVTLQDGDQISLEISSPPKWRPEQKTVLMLHGLTGSDRSPYLVRLTRKFLKRGWRVVRMNLRGCGSGQGLARRPYHAGLGSDLGEVLDYLIEREPNSPYYVIGFSLSGNLVLKYAGSISEQAPKQLRHVIAVCPAVSLGEDAERVTHAWGGFYNRLFVRELKREIREREIHFPDHTHADASSVETLLDFDRRVTAPAWGFNSARAFYEAATAKPQVPMIRVPTHILLSKDDPIIDHSTLDAMPIPDCVHIWKTSGGGHLGFLGSPVHGHSFRWMDDLLLRWIT